MKAVTLSELKGIAIGHAQDQAGGTGCTVILCEGGATAGVDVRGGAPGTRETDLLNPVNYVEEIHGIVLAGGSAFGLDAAAGVMAYLEERGSGFDVGVAKVPIVAGAVLFDLHCGNPDKRPDKEMGYQACLNAMLPLREGSVGAGTGATVGKLLGMEYAMKGGFGSACIKLGELIVGAVVAVNCLGDVVDPRSGEIISGALRREDREFLNCEESLLREYQSGLDPFKGNTTIGCILTNAKMTKAQANKIASMAHNGYARTIYPAHTQFDGDTIFSLGTGEIAADTNVLGVLAARMMADAVVCAVRKATSLHGFLSRTELFPQEE